ncbi:blast:Putative ribosome-binding factor A%2C mitochondrial [Drosophila guanche]|nr:blast:Putative ribosome-binding factor A%2C mitochondrial [Drosophila guanche]
MFLNRMWRTFYITPHNAIARGSAQVECIRTKATNRLAGNVIRQSKIMGKLYGNRLAGSKKRWYPLPNMNVSSSSGTQQPNIVFPSSKFGLSSPHTNKNNARRISVLNKLFMTNITDLLATGAAAQSIVGLGLHVTRVKISCDFSHINVYWLGRTCSQEDTLEIELKRCSSHLQHELTQLRLMGKMPRIQFVRDKPATNHYQMQGLFSDLNLNKNLSTENEMRQNVLATNVQWPKMRQDVLDLNHNHIVDTIVCKMRKLKEAWVDHLQ